MSAWVTVWVAEQVAASVGASVVGVHVIEPASATGSLSATFLMVTLPVLVTVTVYRITSPSAA